MQTLAYDDTGVKIGVIDLGFASLTAYPTTGEPHSAAYHNRQYNWRHLHDIGDLTEMLQLTNYNYFVCGDGATTL
jgi:hypothetical protein